MLLLLGALAIPALEPVTMRVDPGTPSPVPTRSRPAATPQPPTGSTVTFEGDPSGTMDQTAALQAFIDATPDGALVLFRPGARYRVDCTIWVSYRERMTFDGQGAEFFTEAAPCPSQTIWRFHGGGGHVVRRMRIDGGHDQPGTYIPELEFQMGIESLGVVDLEITEVSIARVRGDCVYVGYNNQHGGHNEWSSDVWIHDVECVGIGRQGIAVTAARDVLIEQTRLSNLANVAFDLEPDGPPNGVTSITIRDNVISGPVGSAFVSMGGNGPISGIVVEGNRVESGANHGIWTLVEPRGEDGRMDLVFRANVGASLFNADRRGVFILDRTTRAVVEGNVQPLGRPVDAFVTASRSCEIIVGRNETSAKRLLVQTEPSC